MSIVVQNCLTREYLADPGHWTPAVKEARRFRTSFEAYEHCQAHNVPDSQVVLKFNRAEFDVKLPVSASCRESH